ncbi:hypothetical protein PhCBS80983_g05107 [Powellomyces hirtus]|uniref:Carrier domain-containing protein n=1 Tax=Powellomyces hirtus TaxID=109895 RepID=A0A507DXS4_9FUNG|nr:hypothetical protein PhCBS80983_g05107 [Powellomyces hirtus]
MSSEHILNEQTFIAHIEAAVAQNPSNVYVKYPKNGEYCEVNGYALGAAIKRGSDQYRQLLPKPTSHDPPVYGLLSTSHISYMLNLLSLMSTDCVPLLLSPRNAILGIADLLKRSNAAGIVVESSKFDGVVSELRKELPELKVYSAIDFDGILDDVIKDTEHQQGQTVTFGISCTAAKDEKVNQRWALGLHSSGSTAFPKLRYWTNRACKQNTWVNFANVNAVQDMYTCILLPAPLFHMMGCSNILKVLQVGGTILFPLALAPYRAADLVHAIEKGQAVSTIITPSSLESLVKYLDSEPGGWTRCKSLKKIVYGGAPCPDAVVAAVQKHGIGVRSGYGSTEIGVVLSTVSSVDSADYNVFKPTVDTKYLKWEPLGDDVYRLHVSTEWPGFATGVTDNGKWYDTNDLWLKLGNGGYKHSGRGDDIIVHLNGEKTNPSPMELALRTHPIVYDALVVGSGRFQCSAFILLNRTEMLKYTPLEIMEQVYLAMEDANAAAPQHSRLVKELVDVLPLGHKDFVRTDGKGNIKRGPTEKMLEDRISRLYERYEKGETTSAAGPNTGDVVEYARGVIAEVLKVDAATISDSKQSLFELGLDSLGATQVRNKLVQYLHQDIAEDILFNYSSMSELSTYLQSLQPTASSLEELKRTIRAELAEILNVPVRQISDEVRMFELGLDSLGATALRNRLSKSLRRDVKVETIFDNSTVTALASIFGKDALQRERKESPKLRKTRDMLDKYISIISKLKPLSNNTNKVSGPHTILLTGSSGALGVAILSTLLSTPSVAKIYCLHRGGNDLEREYQAYEQRGLNVEELKRAEKQGKVEGLTAKFEDEHLGVGQEAYQVLAEQVTDVIHVAWPVNWAFPVEAFDGTLKGVCNLISLSNTHHKKSLHFVSSIAAYITPKGATIPEAAVPDDPTVASAMGYGLSKWISERMIEEASRQLHLPATILRSGQLAGDTRTGAWNATDFCFGLVASGVNLRVLPQSEERVDWIPMDVAATGIVELTISPATNKTRELFNVYHIVNPNAASWTDICDTLTHLGYPIKLIPRGDFLNTLEKPENRARNPAVSDQLLPVMQRMLSGSSQAARASLAAAKTANESSSIRDCVNVSDARYWKVLLKQFHQVGAVSRGGAGR